MPPGDPALAARTAVEMAQRKVIVAKQTVNNGKIDVPAILGDIYAVTKENMDETVIKDGFHPRDEVYRGVSAQQPPAQ